MDFSCSYEIDDPPSRRVSIINFIILKATKSDVTIMKINIVMFTLTKTRDYGSGCP